MSGPIWQGIILAADWFGFNWDSWQGTPMRAFRHFWEVTKASLINNSDMELYWQLTDLAPTETHDVEISWEHNWHFWEVTNASVINSLWPSDAIWWWRSESTLVHRIGSCDGLLPNSTKPLPEPMLIDHEWPPVAFTRVISQEMLFLICLSNIQI